MSELTQVISKMMYVGGFDYWHGRDLKPEFIEEFGDVWAILQRVYEAQTDEVKEAIVARRDMKAAKYKGWWDDN